MNLKELRQSQGLTQAAAGKKLGVTRQRWSKLEQDFPRISLSNIMDIMNAFKVDAVIDPVTRNVVFTYDKIEDNRTQDEVIRDLGETDNITK